MPRAPRLLRRFLPAGAPGPAGLAGVPTDRVADVTAELAAVFTALAATEGRCDEILRQGRRDAAEAARDASARVRAIAAAAERRAAAERVDALVRAQRIAEERTRSELAAAQAQAVRLRADGLHGVPELVQRITSAVSAMVTAPGRDGGV